MAKRKALNKLTQPLRPALSIIIICVVVIGGIMLLLFRSTHSDVQQQPQRQTPLRAPTPTRAPHITYTSHKLGISFTYATMASGVQNVFTKEIGNTVYLYTNVNTGSVNQPFSGTDAEFLRTIAPGSKYVEVFSKKPAESLTNTLKTKFLQGYAPNNCPILPTTLAKSSERRSRVSLKISTPRVHYKSFADAYAAEKLCPPVYTDAGRGGAYFMMDADHRDKVFFFRIGQDNLSSGVWGKGTWDTSLEIF